MKHLKISLMKRFDKFTNTLCRTRKHAARYLFDTVINDCRSTIGRNKRFLELNLLKSDAACKSVNKLEFHPIPMEDIWRLSVVDELLYSRDYDNCIGWTREDIDEALIELCTF